MSEAKKQIYLTYRNQLEREGVRSFYDMNGNVFTSCGECDKKECKARVPGGGCMNGETKPDIMKRIER